MTDLPAPPNGSEDNDLVPPDVRTFAAVISPQCTCQWIFDSQDGLYQLLGRRRGCPDHWWTGEADV